MEVRKWDVFLAAVDSGSFTKAGEVLGYTQSGITQMMKSLEQEVGFPLFNKGHAGVSITKEGELLLPCIRHLMVADETLKQEISFLKGAKKGTLRIGTYTSCSIHWLPEIIGQFQKEYPGIIFDIMEGRGNEIAEWIMNRKVDIAFTSFQKSQSYQFIHVYDDPMMAVFPKGHPFEKYEEVPIELYENVPFLISEYTYDNDIHRVLRESSITPDTKLTTSNDFSLLSMIEHGLGVTILPELVLKNHSGNYESRKLAPHSFRKLGIAVYSFDDMSPAMRIFIKYVRGHLLSNS